MTEYPITKYETNNQNIVESPLSENGEAWNDITITKPKPTHNWCKVTTSKRDERSMMI